MKLFRTGDINIVKSCQSYFSFNLPSVLLKNRAEKFELKYKKIMQTYAKWINICSRYCKLNATVLLHSLYAYRLEWKCHYYFFFFIDVFLLVLFGVLPYYVVNKDEYNIIFLSLLQRSALLAMQSAVITRGILSVCLSVIPSRSGIVSRRIKIRSCGFQPVIGQSL